MNRTQFIFKCSREKWQKGNISAEMDNMCWMYCTINKMKLQAKMTNSQEVLPKKTL